MFPALPTESGEPAGWPAARGGEKISCRQQARGQTADQQCDQHRGLSHHRAQLLHHDLCGLQVQRKGVMTFTAFTWKEL